MTEIYNCTGFAIVVNHEYYSLYTCKMCRGSLDRDTNSIVVMFFIKVQTSHTSVRSHRIRKYKCILVSSNTLQLI